MIILLLWSWTNDASVVAPVLRTLLLTNVGQ
mgnify:FL=1